MSKKQRGNTLKFDDMLVSYDYKKDIFTITSKDKDLAGKPFQITLNNTSDTENSIREIFVEKGIIKETENNTLPILPKYISSTDSNKVPLGVSYDGELLWDMNKIPNLLINGHIGSGGTVFTRTILHHCERFNNEIEIKLFGDPIEYNDEVRKKYKVHTHFNNVISELLSVKSNIEERYRQMEKEEVTNINDLFVKPKRIVLFINEFYYFIEKARSNGEKEHLLYLLTDIARTGRAAGLSIVVRDKFSEKINEQLLYQFSGRIIAGNTDVKLSQKYLNSDRAGRNQVQPGYAYANFNIDGKIEKYPTLFSMYYLKETE